ncbi:hypothetical protein [Burkholderia stabilis]|uniref:hypothetical protein n=1 Tax=Burkholderia stabilis TaxID=95485 RepID=UPI001FC82E9E|nr:hypothetical protein [Burkholderia stabilis]
MTPKQVDMTNTEAVLREIFDEDLQVKDRFAAHLGAELLSLSEALAACFALLPAINEAANRAETMRTAFVAGFVFGVLDDVLTSTKLLVTGKLLASGNLMRQVLEGMAMALLCAHDAPLIIGKKNVGTKKAQNVVEQYWKALEADGHYAQGHHAIKQLDWNKSALHLTDAEIAGFEEARKHYNRFSHAGKLSIAGRVDLEGVGVAYVGGHFDDAKLDGYRAELHSRIDLCRMLPGFMRRMLASIARGKDASPAPMGAQ